ncbi:hypothetical protein [Natronococcus sp. JC468]|nr:hypothetical protein [Natronococcus sp. JC468]
MTDRPRLAPWDALASACPSRLVATAETGDRSAPAAVLRDRG